MAGDLEVLKNSYYYYYNYYDPGGGRDLWLSKCEIKR